MAATTRLTVTLPTEQVAELKKLTDNVSGYVAEAVARGDLRVGRGGSVGGRRVNERFATVVLDSQGLSARVAQDRGLLVKPDLFVSVGAEFVTCANTIVEVIHARVDRARLNWCSPGSGSSP